MPYEIPMNFLNNNGSKSARLSTSAVLGAVALHAAALWGLIMQPQPPARLPEVLEFALLEPTGAGAFFNSRR